MPAFIIKWRAKKHGTAEYGLVVSKKTFPTAVARNRAKRLLRAWLAQTGLLNDFDILFIAKRQILETDLDDGIKQIKTVFKKIA